MPLTYSLTPSGTDSDEPGPPEDSPPADDRAAALQLQCFLQIVGSYQTVVGECWPVRNRLVKREEPSLVRSSVKSPNDDHFWPIFAGSNGEIVNPVARGLQFKRDEPDRMPDAPISGDGVDDGADGRVRMCCFGGDWWSQVRTIRTTEWTITRTSVGSSAAMCARMDRGSDTSGLSVGR